MYGAVTKAVHLLGPGNKFHLNVTEVLTANLRKFLFATELSETASCPRYVTFRY
jgi:hypothetical protein